MKIKKALFITLSNIGDVIMTLPVLDYLRVNFPEVRITVLVGPRPKEIFAGSPFIDKMIIYDKHARLKEKIRLFHELNKEKFDLVIDLRNSLFGALLSAKKRISPFLVIPKHIRHMKDRHLYKIKNQISLPVPASPAGRRQAGKYQKITDVERNSLHIHPEDKAYLENLLKKNNITEQDKIVIISAGARSHVKRWAKEKFVELIPSLIREFAVKVILVGDKDDTAISKYIVEHCQSGLIDLTAKTNIPQLACLFKRAKLLITNDSANLHLASYSNIPIVAIFGPTDEEKYGPWSDSCVAVKKEIFCRPCAKAQCRFGNLRCTELIRVDDVLRAVRKVSLANSQQPTANSPKYNFKRILIVRTDRIGDVLLSTPVIKAFRDAYPYAYIAMMVSPYAQDIINGNPDLDEVVIYDKDTRHKNWINALNFALRLKQKKFDLAIALHPTNRVHILTFFAGILKRIGYDRKCGFLLTDRIKHTKHLGQKHELEYNLDLVRYLGIEPKDKSLFMPIRPESEKWVEDLFQQEGIAPTDKLLAIHPGASCISKIWPAERFAFVADKLIERYGLKALIVSGPKDIRIAKDVIKHLHHRAINLAGETSVSQLASLLKKCSLFISNDSGPVHISTSVGTPVISIFGRSLKGLSPRRWGPLGKNDRILHKDVGCKVCLAHNCIKGFSCINAITAEDVLNAVLFLSQEIGL